MAIFIIGVEAVLLYFFAPIMRLAVKYSKFNLPMAFNSLKSTFFLVFVIAISCGNSQQAKTENTKVASEKPASAILTDDSSIQESKLILGANRTETYLPLLKGKNIGIVGNPTSLILKSELPDGEKKICSSG